VSGVVLRRLLCGVLAQAAVQPGRVLEIGGLLLHHNREPSKPWRRVAAIQNIAQPQAPLSGG
jgi:hypothetical protein